RDRNVTGVQTCALPISRLDADDRCLRVRRRLWAGAGEVALHDAARGVLQSGGERGVDLQPTLEQELAPLRDALAERRVVLELVEIGRASCRERVRIRVM